LIAMLICADARALPLADNSVDCVVTSPPYWGLRDYGNAGQLGQERSLTEYVVAMVGVGRQLARVLKPSGTLWLNLGDRYGDNELIGIPWRVAFALQLDGWYIRSEVIWHKLNCLPESVRDRPSRVHEQLFLLTKSIGYFYDADAIREPLVELLRDQSDKRRAMRMNRGVVSVGGGQTSKGVDDGAATTHTMRSNPAGANARSVWRIATKPYRGLHFATFPDTLVERCILAGCPVGGRVLDPFIGSGTTGAVAERLGRRWVGADLTYQHLARARTAQRGLMWESAATSQATSATVAGLF
jgi:DNA modification methylase